jgi:Cu+-exporting ATPase
MHTVRAGIRFNEATSPSRAARVQFDISGMSCAVDSVRLEHRLAHREGILHVVVNLVTETAYVDYDPKLTSPHAVREYIEHQGFGVQTHPLR